jgi:hypothetical protein
MGLFAFRRMSDREVAAAAVASLSNAEPTSTKNTSTKPRRRGKVKQLSQSKNSGQAKAD